MKAKLKPIPKGLAGDVVARGEADLAVQLMPELMSVSGVDVVGSFPAELQSYVVLTGGISTSAPHRDKAQAFLRFLTRPAAILLMHSKGLEPA